MKALQENLTLYSFRRCPFAIRVRMTLEEKEIPYQIVEEKLSALSAKLKSLHPEGRVPLLVHHRGEEQRVIYQSSIITEYLDEIYPQLPLMPKDGFARTQVRLWTYWCDQLFKPDLDLLKYKLPTLSEIEATALTARLHSYLLKWDGALSSQPFLLGQEMTLTDIHLFPFARQFFNIKPIFEGAETYVHIQKWLAFMVARPAFIRAMSQSANI
jgi:glutathione S-transferase